MKLESAKATEVITAMNFVSVKILIIAICIGMSANTTSYAQETFEEWKKKQEEKYESFKEERDKEFMNYLKEAWTAIGAKKGSGQYDEPKPETLPEADTTQKPENSPKKADETKNSPVQVSVSESIPDDQKKSDSAKKMKHADLSQINPEKTQGKQSMKTARTVFHRVPFAFQFDGDMSFSMGGDINNKNISKYWETMSSSDYSSTLERALRTRKQLQLNDWGYTNLLYTMAGKIYGDHHNERVLFTWFMLSKSDYMAKAGYNEEDIFLLTPSQNRLYNTDYFKIDGEKFYVFVFNEKEREPRQVHTYEGTYPDADKKMSFYVNEAPSLEKDMLTKTLTFSYGESEYSVNVSINKNLVSYYKIYPQADLDVYFSADVTPEIRSGLLEQLRPLIEGKSEYEAVNMILRFVQTAFEYQVDHEQFGKEKYLFPEETLFYPASDCEDRTVLFAYLVQQLTGLDVIGLRYPTHIATAVHFTELPEGEGDSDSDNISVDGSTYTVADPTYKYADVGMSMPKHKNKQPEVLRLD